MEFRGVLIGFVLILISIVNVGIILDSNLHQFSFSVSFSFLSIRFNWCLVLVDVHVSTSIWISFNVNLIFSLIRRLINSLLSSGCDSRSSGMKNKRRKKTPRLALWFLSNAATALISKVHRARDVPHWEVFFCKLSFRLSYLHPSFVG